MVQNNWTTYHIDIHAIQEKSKGDYRFVSHNNKGINNKI
jgi:hypothetical protein